MIAETDSANAVLARYLHGPGTDEPFEMKRGTTTSYYAADGLGSIAHLTSSIGAVVERYSYDPYGVPTIKNGSGAIIPTSAFSNRFLYTGREWDSEIGSYFYRARYYRPTIGRFVSQDPLGHSAGINLYSYADNSPINKLDPLGTLPIGTAAPDPTSNPGFLDSVGFVIPIGPEGGCGVGGGSQPGGGSEAGRGNRWGCQVRCNVHPAKPGAICPDRVEGVGYGPTPAIACNNAEFDAKSKLKGKETGCQTKHCHPVKTWKL